VVIYVRDFLARYDVDALRYYIAVAGPETHDTDFTWSEFVRRNNDELVATWGNLVNRAVSFAAKNIGSIPPAGDLTEADRALLDTTSGAFAAVGDHLSHSRFKFAVNDAMRAVGEANKYFSEQAPWKLRTSEPERMRTVLHVTLQAIADAKTMLTPFLPRSSQAVHEMLGGTGDWSGMPRIETVDEEGGPSYPVITGTYDSTFRWESRPVAAGAPLAVPVPLFTKLDQSVVDEEIARLSSNE
jgi:methionyl-tRNA synthetase